VLITDALEARALARHGPQLQIAAATMDLAILALMYCVCKECVMKNCVLNDVELS